MNNKIKNDIQCKNKNFYFSIGNNSISLSWFEYTNTKVPQAFDGYKILQVSDLHNHLFGNEQSNLISRVKAENPNLIVITGDLIDRRHTDIDTAMSFIRNIVSIAPVYFVQGNHEARLPERGKLYKLLKKAGVTILDDSYIDIKKDNESIRIIGLADPSLYACGSDEVDNEIQKRLKQTLLKLIDNSSKSFNILLSHRPDLINIYSECGADLVFSGHAHGGQVRLPFIGGLYSPGQGVFPRLTSGIHNYGNTSLVISRGLGNSLFPLRIFNPPEIVVLELVY